MKLVKLLGLLVLFAGFSGVTQLRSATDDALLELLCKTYDLYKDNFIDYIPKNVSIDECKQVLINGKESLQQQMASLSYIKDVFFSKEGKTNIAALVGLPALLEYGPRPVKGWKRDYLVLPTPVYSEWYESLRKQFGNRAAEYMVYDGYQGGIIALWAYAGFSFVRDVKMLRDKKNSLSQDYEKCTKMLAVLEAL